MERGFRFLKDPSFWVASVYRKKLSRIQALVMVMVLCLFMYAMTEFRLRRDLQDPGETVTGQTKKQTRNPTLKWMLFRFRGVRELRFRAEEALTVIVTNMTQELWKILRLRGKEYENYYLCSKTCGMSGIIRLPGIMDLSAGRLKSEGTFAKKRVAAA